MEALTAGLQHTNTWYPEDGGSRMFHNIDLSVPNFMTLWSLKFICILASCRSVCAVEIFALCFGDDLPVKCSTMYSLSKTQSPCHPPTHTATVYELLLNFYIWF